MNGCGKHKGIENYCRECRYANVGYNKNAGGYGEPCHSCKHGDNTKYGKCLFEYESESGFSPVEISGNAAGAVHYQSGIQPIEFFQSVMGEPQFQGFLQGNVLKYAARIGKKDSALKDAQKIRQYAHWLVLALEGKKIDPRKDVL